jgi:hypothetical protein
MPKKFAAAKVLVADDEPLIRWALAETLGPPHSRRVCNVEHHRSAPRGNYFRRYSQLFVDVNSGVPRGSTTLCNLDRYDVMNGIASRSNEYRRPSETAWGFA